MDEPIDGAQSSINQAAFPLEVPHNARKSSAPGTSLQQSQTGKAKRRGSKDRKSIDGEDDSSGSEISPEELAMIRKERAKLKKKLKTLALLASLAGGAYTFNSDAPRYPHFPPSYTMCNQSLNIVNHTQPLFGTLVDLKDDNGSISDSTDTDTEKEKKKRKKRKGKDQPDLRPPSQPQDEGLPMQTHPVGKAAMPSTTTVPSDAHPSVDSIVPGSEQSPNVHSTRPSKPAPSALPAPAPPSNTTTAAMPNQEKQLNTSSSDAEQSQAIPSVPLSMQDAPPTESMLVSASVGQVNDGFDLPDLLPALSNRMESQQPQDSHGTLPSPVNVHEDLVFNEAKLPEEDPEEHGSGISVPPAEGYFATKHYPSRKLPLRMPTGTITKQAYGFRYSGLSKDDIISKIRDIQHRSEACPAVFQHALKSSAKGNFDVQVHWWLTPVLQRYHLLGDDRQARSRYLRGTVLPDLFKVFPDLHPDYIKVRDTDMEKVYLDKTCNTISAAYHQLRSKLKVPGKLEVVDKDVIKWLSEPSQPPRPHDLWARSELDRSNPGTSEKQSSGPTEFARAWKEKKAKCMEELGAETWEANRLSIEQEFRKKAFEKLPDTEQKIWVRQATAEHKPVDKTTAFVRGLPFVTHVLKRFTELAQVPMAILLGAPDPQEPGKLLIYHDTYVGPAPAHIEDFWSGPSQLGTRQIIPEWRRFVADVFQKSPDAIQAETQGLPEMAAPSPPPAPATERIVNVNGIKFLVTPPPQNWCVRSAERDEIIKNLRTSLGESWKETFGRARVDFNAMRNRTSDFTSSEHLPRSRKKMQAGPGGVMTLVDALEETICVPSDPRTMDPPVLEAWYTMFVDDSIPEARRFRWFDAKVAVVSRAKKIPASVQIETSRSSEKPASKGKGKQSSTTRSNRQSNNDTEGSEEDEIPTDYIGESETSAGEGPPNPRSRQPTISRSGRISAAPQILAPISDPRPRSSSQSHGTIMPSSDAPDVACASTSPAEGLEGRFPDSVGSTRPTQTAHPSHVTAIPERALQKSCEVISPTVPKSNPGTFFKLRPPKDRYPLYLPARAIEQISSFEYFHNIPLPSDLKALTGVAVPHLTDLLTRCVDLDLLFPVDEVGKKELGLRDLRTAIDTLWLNLEDLEKPLPTYLFASELCRKSNQLILQAVIRPAVKHVQDQLEALDSMNICTLQPGAPPQFQSWTQYLVATARFLNFLFSIPPNEINPQISQELARLNTRLSEIACIYLIYRYTTSSTTAFISSHPKATAKPTIASTASTLGTAWIYATYPLFNPINRRSLVDVLGENWVQQVDDMQPKNPLPFFHLHDVSKRWLVINPTISLEHAVIDLAVNVNANIEAFGDLATYQHFTLLAAVFAITANSNRETSDVDWIRVVETFLDGFVSMSHGGESYESEHQPCPPPPTMIGAVPSGSSGDHPSSDHQPAASPPPTPHRKSPAVGLNEPSVPSVPPAPPSDMQIDLPNEDEAGPVLESDPSIPHYSRPKSRTGGRSKWIAGDVIKLTARGISKDVKIRQKGADPRNLVLTWIKSREPVLSQSGSPIPLPPFDISILVTPGPFMKALDQDCFIRDRPLPPYLPFHEILSGIHDDYLRELFEKNPETRPSTPEPEEDEIDSLLDEAKVQALKLRIERRRQFRESLSLPPDPQDLADEAKLAALLESTTQGPPVPQTVMSSPPLHSEQPSSLAAQPGLPGDSNPRDFPQPDAPPAQGYERREADGSSTQPIPIENRLVGVVASTDSQNVQGTATNANGKRKRSQPMGTVENKQSAENPIADGDKLPADNPTAPDIATPRRSTRRKQPAGPDPPPTTKAPAKSKATAAASASRSNLKDKSRPESGVAAQSRDVAGKKKASTAKSKARLESDVEITVSLNQQSGSIVQTRSKSKATQAVAEPEDGIQEPPLKKTRLKR